jgi:hypothetical protein
VLTKFTITAVNNVFKKRKPVQWLDSIFGKIKAPWTFFFKTIHSFRAKKALKGPTWPIFDMQGYGLGGLVSRDGPY